MSSCDPEEEVAIRASAMRLLARREHSRLELKNKLENRGFEEIAVSTLLDRLENENLLSDKRFTRSFIENRSLTGYGPNRIRFELANRGVSRAVANDLIEEANIDWNQCSLDLMQKKFGTDKPENFSDWAKRARYLEQRGFELDEIHFAIGHFA